MSDQSAPDAHGQSSADFDTFGSVPITPTIGGDVFNDHHLACRLPLEQLLTLMARSDDAALASYARATLVAISRGVILAESADAVTRDMLDRLMAGEEIDTPDLGATA